MVCLSAPVVNSPMKLMNVCSTFYHHVSSGLACHKTKRSGHASVLLVVRACESCIFIYKTQHFRSARLGAPASTGHGLWPNSGQKHHGVYGVGLRVAKDGQHG